MQGYRLSRKKTKDQNSNTALEYFGSPCRGLGPGSWLGIVLKVLNEALKQCILRFEVLLDLKRLVQNGLGILVGIVAPSISCRALNFLTYHDDRQQDQLQKGLRNP